MDRYARQILLPMLGLEGQQRLGRSRVLLVGCGALGCSIAEQLARAGVGLLRIADRDLVELPNLHRQCLFDERDAAENTPKAAAAARRLAAINSRIRIEPHILDVHAGNIEQLAGLSPGGEPVDLVLDGTDNAETRYLINDLAVQRGIPWVYGACVGAEGRAMAIQPGTSACLRCLFESPPAPGELPTCDTVGVLGPAAIAVAAMQAALAIRLLAGGREPLEPRLISMDLWEMRVLALRPEKRPDCPCCGLRRFDFLEAPGGGTTISLCGRNAVQVRPARPATTDLAAAARRLAAAGRVEVSPYFVRCWLHAPSGITLTLFPDGRLIVQGTSDSAEARTLAARFVGT